ncbi:(2Fe-2S)-binding protein [Candidatus Peribacteria bacterium]|nr:MAG: (2Fe-2S)-binding protein [Candidatus Peribacteria bacterium]
MPKVTFIQENGQITVVEAAEGERILHIALDNGIPMEHACGGNGFCTTCMCKVKEGMGNLSPRNDREENMGIVNDPDRLSCQSEVMGDVTVEVIEY